MEVASQLYNDTFQNIFINSYLDHIQQGAELPRALLRIARKDDSNIVREEIFRLMSETLDGDVNGRLG